MDTNLVAYVVTVSILSAIIYANSFNVAWSDETFVMIKSAMVNIVLKLYKSVRINKDMMT